MEQDVLHLVRVFAGLAVHAGLQIEVQRVVAVLLLPGLEGLVRLQVVAGVALALAERQVLREEDPIQLI